MTKIPHRSTIPTREIIGTLWPHGGFSVGWRESSEPAIDRDRRHIPGLVRTQESTHSPQRTRSRNGLKGISTYGRNMVKSAATLLEENYGQPNLTLLTLTLPPLSVDEGRILLAGWGQLVGRLIQWICRKLAHNKIPPLVISVSEVQPQRSKFEPHSSIHLHLLFPGRQRGRTWIITPSEVSSWWGQEIERRIHRSIPTSAVARLERVKKSVSAYLSKYLSKGEQDLSQMPEDAIPGQWWNRSAAMADLVARNIRKGVRTGRYLLCLIRQWESDPEAAKKIALYPVWSAWDSPQLLGWSGYIRDKTLLWDVRRLLKCD